MPAWAITLVALVLGLPLLAVFLYFEENWRARSDWNRYRQELKAKGEPIDWAEFVPKPVPDPDNIYAAPKMAEWFVGRGTNELWRRLSDHLSSDPKVHATTDLIEFTIVRTITKSNSAGADLVLRFDPPFLRFASAEAETVAAPTAPAAILPQITFEDVPLSDAVKALARAGQFQCRFDAQLGFSPLAAGKTPKPEPLVNLRFTNVTARQALAGVLASCQLQMTNDARTGVWQIGAAGPNPPLARVDPQVGDAMLKLARSSLEKLTNDLRLPAMKGAQNIWFHVEPLRPVRPVRVVVQADEMPTADELKAFVPRCVVVPAIGVTAALEVERTGTNQFHAHLSQPSSLSAADYLEWSDQFEPEFNLMRQALKRPSARLPGDYSAPSKIPIPNFLAIRAVAQVLGQRAQCHLLLNRSDEAVRDLTLMHDLRRLLDAKPAGRPITLVAAMIDVAVAGLYANVICDGLRQHAWNDRQLAALQEQLQSVDLISPVAEALRQDRAWYCQLFLKLRSGVDESGVKLSRSAFVNLLPDSIIYRNIINRSRLLDDFALGLDATNRLIRPARAEAAASELAEMDRHKWNPYTFLGSISTPDFTRAAHTLAQNQTCITETLVVAALERSRLARGTYPADLAALVPQYLETVPRDIIGGKPLIYRRTEDGGFILYSVGWNEKDDGGSTRTVPSTKPGVSEQLDWVWPVIP